jgi:hypothetical protein
MDKNGNINHTFGTWLPCNVLYQQNALKYYYQSASGFHFKESDGSYLFMRPEAKRRTYANYKADGYCYPTQNLPNDCITSDIRVMEKVIHSQQHSTNLTGRRKLLCKVYLIGKIALLNILLSRINTDLKHHFPNNIL